MSFIPSRVLGSVTALVLLGLGTAQAGQAQTFTWNFDNTLPANTISHGYLDTSGKYTLTAYGYKNATSPGAPKLGDTWNIGQASPDGLYGKKSGDISETGLGLADKSEFEIDGTSFIQLDVSGLKNAHLTNLTMFVSSIQQNEGFFLWGSNTQGAPGTLLKTYVNTTGANGADTNSFLVPHYADYNYFTVSADGGNVLLRNGLTATAATPEPGSMALLATSGLSGAGLLIRKRRRK